MDPRTRAGASTGDATSDALPGASLVGGTVTLRRTLRVWAQLAAAASASDGNATWLRGPSSRTRPFLAGRE